MLLSVSSKSLSRWRDSDLYPVIHGRLSLDARFVDHELAPSHVERHLPGSGFGLLRRLS
jgi:hypothetical protein